MLSDYPDLKRVRQARASVSASQTLEFTDQESMVAALQDLASDESKTDWVGLVYQANGALSLGQTGQGGFEEVILTTRPNRPSFSMSNTSNWPEYILE